MTGQPTEVRVVANVMKEICYRNKAHLLASLIVAGWDSKAKGSVFCIPLGGALVEEPFAIGGVEDVFGMTRFLNYVIFLQDPDHLISMVTAMPISSQTCKRKNALIL